MSFRVVIMSNEHTDIFVIEDKLVNFGDTKIQPIEQHNTYKLSRSNLN
jgi:hypothetical protein